MLQEKQRLGDFEVIRPLGKGGMGEVYEAQQFNPPRRVALKVLAPWLSQDDDALRRFWQEAAVPAALDHPCIVRIISSGKTPEGQAYYTMQLVRGLSLAEIIRRAEDMPNTVQERTTPYESRTGPQPPSSSPETVDRDEEQEELDDIVKSYARDRFALAAEVGLQAARALAYAHRKKVMHRDIKPSNLMLDHHGQLYIVDFGLTRMTGGGGDGSMAGIRGTPWYMSPEQANGQKFDQRSDLYSLGVTLYELVTRGVGPYTASRLNTDAVLEQVRAGQFLPLQMLAPDVPKELKKIIQKATAFHPKRRYQSAEELVWELEGILSNRGSSVRSSPRPKRGWRVPVGVAAVIVVLSAIALYATNFFAPKDRDTKNDTGNRSTSLQPSTSPVSDPGPKYPEHFRNRPMNVPISLLTRDVEPVWSRVLYGHGNYNPVLKNLSLFSPPKDHCTMLALDNDPQQRWFEFAIEIGPMKALEPDLNEVGIFFGWRETDKTAAQPSRFFIVQLKEFTDPNAGRLVVGLPKLVPAQGDRGETTNWPADLPESLGSAALPKLKDWRKVVVRVVDHQATIAVDGMNVLKFNMDAVRKAAPFEPGEFDSRGAIGIWVRKGRGMFRNASITALPGGTARSD